MLLLLAHGSYLQSRFTELATTVNKRLEGNEPIVENNTANSINYNAKVMTVTAKSGLNVREGAGTNYPIKKAYPIGTKIKVYSIDNGWAKSDEGYLFAKYLSPEENNYKVMTVIARSGLNVREGAGINYRKITAYKYGTKVRVLWIQNGWAKGTQGYMCAKYLK